MIVNHVSDHSFSPPFTVDPQNLFHTQKIRTEWCHKQSQHYFRPRMGAKYCDVCVCVRPLAYLKNGTSKLHTTFCTR